MSAWDDARALAWRAVKQLESCREDRLVCAVALRQAEREHGLALALLQVEAAAMGSNDLARRAALAQLQAERENYRQTRDAEDEARDALVVADNEIAAAHDALSLLKRELDWLIADRGSQREEVLP